MVEGLLKLQMVGAAENAFVPTENEKAVTERLVEELNGVGIPTHVIDSESGERVLEVANELAKMSRGRKKSASETAETLASEEALAYTTDISEPDGANILKEVDKLANKYEEKSNRPRTFLEDVAVAIGATERNTRSKYVTIKAKNGKVFTVRLANHNTTVKQFDHNGETEGVSIVVSGTDNNGITNDGNAHVVEFFYAEKALREATGKPLVSIIRSIEQMLYSGEYKDTTGLAQPEEVNADVVREMRVFHGSGADYNRIDHSHIGEGEGAQAYGWGTYVTEVKGIALSYASQKRNRFTYKGKTWDDLWNDGEPSRKDSAAQRVIEKLEIGFDLAEAIEFVKDDLEGKIQYYDEISLTEDAKYKEIADGYREQLDALQDFKAEDFTENTNRILYTMEIPDSGYIQYEEAMPREERDKIATRLYERLVSDEEGGYDSPQAQEELRKEIISAFRSDGLRGGDIYGSVSAFLGSDKAASEFLHEMGYNGISYPAQYRSGGRADKARNYVIFDENDMQIVDKIKFFRTPNGEAYGFTLDGEIYIDKNIATRETPIHEFVHLWAEGMRKANAEAWEDLKKKLMDNQYGVYEYVKKLYPELEGDRLMEEVFSHFAGRRGAERLKAMEQAELAKAKGVFNKARIVAMFDSLRQLLRGFWEMSRDLFAGKNERLKNMTADDYADMAMADLMHGTIGGRNARSERSSRTGEDIEREAKANGTWLKAPNGAETNLEEKQWKDVRTDNFKGYFGDWERSYQKDFLMNAEPVSRLNGDEFQKKDGKTLTEQVGDFFAHIGGKAVSPVFGDVVLDKDGADDSLSHGMGRNKAISYAAVKDVIEKGIVIDTELNHKQRGYNTAVIAAPISIKGEDYVCCVVIRRNKNGNRFYLHEVTAIKKLHDDAFVTNSAQKPASRGAIAKLLQEIVNSKDNSSKVVDENGEPLVVYHGSRTGAHIKIFDTPAFFSDNYDVADMFKREADFLLHVNDEVIAIDERSAYDIAAALANDDYIEASEVTTWGDMSHLLPLEEGNVLRERLVSALEYAGIDIDLEDIEHISMEAVPEVYSCYLNIRNPLVIDFKGKTWGEEGTIEMETAVRNAAKNGYDGVIVKNIREGGFTGELRNGEEAPLSTDYIPIRPNQIKSATDNIGTFDAENDDIRYQLSPDGRSTTDVEKVNTTFNEQLQQQIEGKLPQGHIYDLGMPSAVLLSTGFPNVPIELSATHLADKAATAHHPFGIGEMKDLVKAIQKPMAVFAYGNKSKSQNVIVEIQHNGDNFVVGIHFNQKRGSAEVSSIRGLYPKDNAEWLNWISQGKLLYADNKKIQTLISQQRRTLADVEYLDLNSIAKIIKDFKNPSIKEEKNGQVRLSVADKESRSSRTGEDVEREARVNGTWLKAPNGAETNLEEKQWKDVRTDSFKGYFGDWERSYQKDFLMNAEPVSKLEAKKIIAREGQSFIDAVYELFEKQGGKANSPFGEVLLDKKGTKNDVKHGVGVEKNISFASVKDVLEKGIIILPLDYYGTSGKKQKTGIVAAPIAIDGKRYICAVEVIANKENSRLYVHEVFTTEKLRENVVSNQVRGSKTASPHSQGAIAKLLQEIVNSKDNSSKVVDENGEPLMVYHSSRHTGRRFHIFNDDKPIWFTPNEMYALSFNENGKPKQRYSVYLNARNICYIGNIDWAVSEKELARLSELSGIPIFSLEEIASKYDAKNIYHITNTPEFRNLMIQLGYDGLEAREGRTTSFAVFSSNQIKSATDNIGTFDAKNDDIRYRLGDSPESFKSRQQKAVENKGTVMPGLNEAEVKVVDVPRHSYKGHNVITQAREAAIDRYSKKAEGNKERELKPQHYNNYGAEFIYYISPKSLKEAANHAEDSENIGVHIAVMDKLHDVINASIEIEEHPDVKKKDGKRKWENGFNDDILMHRFAGAVLIDGTIYRVKTTMKEYKNSKKENGHYTYEVTKIEVLDEKPNTSNGHSNVSNVFVSGAKLLQDVDKSYEKGKKLLAESKKVDEESRSSHNARENADAIAEHAVALGEKLGVKVRVVKDVNEITHPDAEEQARRRGSKGWFNPKTGEVVVVLPNASSVADGLATVFHEVVGHKGLRELFGDRFDDFLDEVYATVGADIRAEIERMAAEEYKGDVRVATEEYLSSLAEDGTFRNAHDRTFWQKVKAAFVKMLRKMGIDIPLTDADLRYVLWKSYNNLSKTARDRLERAAYDAMLREEAEGS